MAEIRFRAATTDDIAALAYLRWEMEAERHPDRQAAMTREEYTTLYAAAVRADMERGAHRAWIAWADGQPAACVTLIWWAMPPIPAKPNRKRGIVTSVFTLPEYRRQSISRRLMEALLENARAEDIERLVLWASDMGRPLYESLDFAQSRGMEWNLDR